MNTQATRALVAEFLGTLLLAAVVLGSGIMAERLCAGNVGLALLCNTIATGAGLVALILTLGPVSGAHFNPVVSVVAALHGQLEWKRVPGFVAAQSVGAMLGVVLANVMFELPAVTFSTHARTGVGLWLSEVVATFGLVAVVVGCSRKSPSVTPFAVSAFIVAGYWFTASSALANPAVTAARLFTDTFGGVRPIDVPALVVAEFVGGVLGALVVGWLVPSEKVHT